MKRPYYQDDRVTIYHADCSEVVPWLYGVGMVVGSPPYYNQREYSNWNTYSDFLCTCHVWMSQCHAALLPGRICSWVVPDKIPIPPAFNENTTGKREYRQFFGDLERFAEKIGFMPEFPIIWDKRGPGLAEQPWSKKLWGSYPYPISIIHTSFTERICIWRKEGNHNLTQKDRYGSEITTKQFNEWATDIWSIRIASGKKHPAEFPEEIPIRLITLWSVKDDIILDPFCGSGRTLVAALKTGRKAIGIDIHKEYCKLALENITSYYEDGHTEK